MKRNQCTRIARYTPDRCAMTANLRKSLTFVRVAGALSLASLMVGCSNTQVRQDERDAPSGLKPNQTRQAVLANSTADDWRSPKPENTLYLELATGRVIFELTPSFAPLHIKNLKRLLAQHYFDDLTVVRVQDNYVAQWGDPQATTDQARSLGQASKQLAGEYFRPALGLAFTSIPSRDPYAEEVGFVDGFPTGRGHAGTFNRQGEQAPQASAKRRAKSAWLLHCYGALGVGRDVSSTSGNSAELYAVIGHSPRHLDRNVTLIGRALKGMEQLSALPRGTGDLGFYEPQASGPTIKRMRLASDLPPNRRTPIEVLRTDTPTFQAWVAASTNRTEAWFIDPTRRVEICNVPIPTRARHAASNR